MQVLENQIIYNQNDSKYITERFPYLKVELVDWFCQWLSDNRKVVRCMLEKGDDRLQTFEIGKADLLSVDGFLPNDNLELFLNGGQNSDWYVYNSEEYHSAKSWELRKDKERAKLQELSQALIKVVKKNPKDLFAIRWDGSIETYKKIELMIKHCNSANKINNDPSSKTLLIRVFINSDPSQIGTFVSNVIELKPYYWITSEIKVYCNYEFSSKFSIKQ